MDTRVRIEAGLPSSNAEHEEIPRLSLTLGWRLGLTASAIVVVVLGGLLAWQQSSEFRRWRHDRRELLAESLAPLQSDIEQAASIEEIQQRLAAYECTYVSGHHPHHRLLLVDAAGEVVTMSCDGQSNQVPQRLLQTSVPVVSPLLPGSVGNLIVQQDASRFETEVAHLRILGVVTIGITVLCLLSGLLLANHFLVARPLAMLVRSVNQMERGYWQKLRIPGGAWELRWLGFRFRRLGAELEATVRRLVEAERRALLRVAEAREQEGAAADVNQRYDPGAPGQDRTAQDLRSDLEQLCHTLETRTAADQELLRLADRVWNFEAPEADRIGDRGLRNRLEDAALRILEPAEFSRVERALSAMTAEREQWAAEREVEIRQVLADQQVEPLAIERRIKHLAGLWRKMQVKGLDADQVQDVFGFRVIVADTTDCYRALHAIHHHFEPQLLRFKDYVASPKANGYQSLHTSVRSSEGPVFEIQIRSRQMDRQAERGTAAHWRYKQSLGVNPGGSPAPGGLRWLQSSLLADMGPDPDWRRGGAPRGDELAPAGENREDGG